MVISSNRTWGIDSFRLESESASVRPGETPGTQSLQCGFAISPSRGESSSFARATWDGRVASRSTSRSADRPRQVHLGSFVVKTTSRFGARSSHWPLPTFAGFRSRLSSGRLSCVDTSFTRQDTQQTVAEARDSIERVYEASGPRPPSPQRRRRVGHIARTFLSFPFLLPHLSPPWGVSRTAIATRTAGFAQPPRPQQTTVAAIVRINDRRPPAILFHGKQGNCRSPKRYVAHQRPRETIRQTKLGINERARDCQTEQTTGTAAILISTFELYRRASPNESVARLPCLFQSRLESQSRDEIVEETKN